MGLFSHFNPFKAVTRAIGLPDKSPITKALHIATLPIFAPTELALQAGGRILSSVSAGHTSQGVQQIHDQGQPIEAGNVPQPVAPSYVYYAGGGGYSPLAGGYSPWDYSTPSTPFLTPQYQTFPQYSEVPQVPQDRTWEDLSTAAAIFL